MSVANEELKTDEPTNGVVDDTSMDFTEVSYSILVYLILDFRTLAISTKESSKSKKRRARFARCSLT
jgi:hypothetical protein